MFDDNQRQTIHNSLFELKQPTIIIVVNLSYLLVASYYYIINNIIKLQP